MSAHGIETRNSTIALNASMSMQPRQVPPSAWIGHLPFAFWAIEEARPRIFVELGSHNGTSYLAFCQSVARCTLDTKCFAIDTWQGDEHSGFYSDEVFQTLFRDNDAQYGGFSQLMRMTFDDALPYFADGSIDLLHIDGLHTYEAVKHDFESWLPKLSDRGVVLFHDTMVRERNFGVWKLWEELRGRYPGFEFQHAHGLGVLLVGDRTPHSLRELAALSATEAEVPVLRLFDALGGRIYAAERANAAEAGLKQALQDAQSSMQAAQSAHEYMSSRINDLQVAESALQAQLQSERDNAAAAAQSNVATTAAVTDALRTLEADHVEMLGQHHTLMTERASAFEVERAALVRQVNALEVERGALARRTDELELERNALVAQVDALEVERAAMAGRTGALELERNALTGHARLQEAELRQIQDTFAAMSARCSSEVERNAGLATAMTRQADMHAGALDDLGNQLAAHHLDYQHRLAAREAELNSKRADIEMMLRSKSWLLTSPMRRLAAFLRRTGA